MSDTQMTPEYVSYLRDKEERERQATLNTAKISSMAGEKREDGFSDRSGWRSDYRVTTKDGTTVEGKVKIENGVLYVKKPGFFRDKTDVIHLDDIKDIR